MKKLTIITMALMMTCSVVVNAGDIDWSKPESIDVTDPELIKTLDVNPEKFLAEGWQAYQDKNYKKAIQYYLAYLQHVKNDTNNIYNLACCYGLMGNAELAAVWVEKAVEAGWTDMDHLNNDKDFAQVRDSEVFKTTVAKLEKQLTDAKGDPGKILMVPSQSMLPIYVKLPENYDAKKIYPLVLGLHGYGSSAEKYAQLWGAQERNFIYAALEAPYAFSLGKELGYSWFIRLDPEKYAEIIKKAGEKTDANVLAGLKRLKKEYKIGKVYLTGFSQGATLTYITGLKHPELFAAIAPFGGWLDSDVITEEDLKAAKDLPVIIVHGNHDSIVKFEEGKKAEELLKKHGFMVQFVEFDGGHTVAKEGLKALQKLVQNSKI